MHYPPVKATTIWAATRCATVTHSLPTDRPSWDQKSVLQTTEICSLQDNIRPFPLSWHTSPSTKSPITFLWHVCVRVACLQLSAWDKCGSAWAAEERTHACSRVMALSENMCLVCFYVSTSSLFQLAPLLTHISTHTHCVLLHALDYEKLHGYL